MGSLAGQIERATRQNRKSRNNHSNKSDCLFTKVQKLFGGGKTDISIIGAGVIVHSSAKE